MIWKDEAEAMNGSLDWVMCRLVVCVPQDLLELATNAVLESHQRILQDPLLEGSASVEVCTYPEKGVVDSPTGSTAPGWDRTARIAEALITSAKLAEVSKAPSLAFCLLIVDRHVEAQKLITDLAVDDGFSNMPILFRAFTEVDAYDRGKQDSSAISTELKHEILRSITSTLEYAGLKRGFRVAPREMTRASATAALEDTAVTPRASSALQQPVDHNSPFGVLQATVAKARSQLAALRAPTTAEAIDQASQRGNSIKLLYLTTVTGSSSPEATRRALKWAAPLAFSITQRISRIEAGLADASPWYVSFLSAGEGVERLMQPSRIGAVGLRHFEAKPKGYDFDLFECSHGMVSIIDRDRASFARRGVAVAEVRTVILSMELPLADTNSIDSYRHLCGLSPVTWVLGTDWEELSSDFQSERSQILFNHADVVEELVSRDFQANVSIFPGRDGLFTG